MVNHAHSTTRAPKSFGAAHNNLPQSRKPGSNAFAPIVKLALTTVSELKARGAVVVMETRDSVTLRRGDQLAKIDSWGRVAWEAVPPADPRVATIRKSPAKKSHFKKPN